MKLMSARAMVLGLVFGLLLAACAGPTPTATPVPTPTPKPVGATPPPSALLKAKQESEAKGYIFETSHDDIVAKAKAEGKMRSLSSNDPANIKALSDAFKAKYPFLDVYVEELTGTDASQRFLLELKSGTVKEWDAAHAATDFYRDFLPYGNKFDILGMAEQRVVDIHPKMVDFKNRNFVAIRSYIEVAAYNKKLLPPDKVPSTWEDFLKPEFKGRKFIVDIRPHCMSVLGLGLTGEEWIKDYSKKIAAQQPVWARGQTRSLASMVAGEYSLHLCMHYSTIARAIAQDPTGALDFKIIEPVPVFPSETDFIPYAAPRPYAGLLWIEFQSSNQGQAIIEKYEPFSTSLYYPESTEAKLAKGKKLAVVEFEALAEKARYTDIVVEAYGFPTAEMK